RDRVGTDGVGYLGKVDQILLDLIGFDMGARDQRGLCPAERRVGHALKLGVGIDRSAREPDRRGKPPPHGRNHSQGNEKERQWRTKRNGSSPPRDRRLTVRRPSAKRSAGHGPPVIAATAGFAAFYHAA